MTFLSLKAAQLTEISFTDALIIALMGFALVMVVLLVLALFVKLLSFMISGAVKKGIKEARDSDALTAPNTPAPMLSRPAAVLAPVSQALRAGYVRLDGTSEKEAAVIMAIVSDKTGIPLSRLAFRSITRLEQNPVLENISEQDAAAVMAITSDKTGIPLDKLLFHSIKLLED